MLSKGAVIVTPSSAKCFIYTPELNDELSDLFIQLTPSPPPPGLKVNG